MSAPALRPLGIGEILDVAIKIYRSHAGTLLAAVTIVVVPVAVLTGLIEVSALPEEEEVVAGNYERELATFAAGFAVGTILTMLGTIVATAACFKAIADAYVGRRSSWRASLGYVLRRLHSVLWVLLLMTLILIPAFIACIVPGVWLGVAYAVAIPALLTEGVKGRKSLGRSFRLVRGRWWQAFAVVFLGYLLTGLVSGALGAVVEGVTSYDTQSDLVAALVADVVANAIASVITVPFIAAFVVVLYFDLRVRKEAFDLQLLARQVGVEPEGGIVVPPPAPMQPAAAGDQPPFWPPPPGWKPSPPEGGE